MHKPYIVGFEHLMRAVQWSFASTTYYLIVFLFHALDLAMQCAKTLVPKFGQGNLVMKEKFSANMISLKIENYLIECSKPKS